MATFTRDFTGDTLASTPSDFTQAIGAGSYLEYEVVDTGDFGRVFRVSLNSSGSTRFLTWTAPGTAADYEVYAELVPRSTSDYLLQLCGRFTELPASNVGYDAVWAGYADASTASNEINTTQFGGESIPSTPIAENTDVSRPVDTKLALLFKGSGSEYSYKIWQPDTESEPGTWTLSGTNTRVSAAGNVGIKTGYGSHSFDIVYMSAGTGTDAAPRGGSTTPTTRKGSTFVADKTGTLGTVTTATLSGINIFDHLSSQDATTATFAGAFTDEITTSGEYSLVLGDGATTETTAIQVNVIGLASFNINKDGADQGSLTDVEFLILTGAPGSRVINQQITGITTTAGGDTGAIEINDTALAVDDTITVAQQSPTVGGGVVHTATLGLI